jgi:hypothetical protein
MSMIFPGMDPFLEDADLWPGFHTSLTVYIRNQLQPLLRPRYIASVEERVYLEGPDRQIIPDVRVHQRRGGSRGTAVAAAPASMPLRIRVPRLEIHEPYLTVLDRREGLREVTVIEVVSPTNKYAGPGRVSYLTKQEEVLRGPAHLVEIDLLRGGPHVLSAPEAAARGRAEYDYLICINRASEWRDEYDLYPCRLRDRLPVVGIPLAGSDPDVPLDLQPPVAQAYDDGADEDRLFYDRPCVPALSDEDQAWAEQLIALARQRPDGAAAP